LAAILTSKFDNVGRQPLFVITPLWNAALCRAMLSENAANTSLGKLQLISDMVDAGTATRGA
jgi:hypothetical protein